MARSKRNGFAQQKPGSKFVTSTTLPERRVATPNPNLVVIKIGESSAKPPVSPSLPAVHVLARVAKAMAKPGADRDRLFQSTSNRTVYAYSIDIGDPTKVVREDASGRRTVGRFIGGRFRPVISTRAL